MQLMTKELERRFAQVGSQEGIRDPLVIAKFFHPIGPATWWATEYDPDERMFFGFVTLGLGETCDEWGPFALDDLESVRGPLGLGIERDRFWTEQPISKCAPHAVENR
jgi:DUF2958 family protein